MFDRGAQFFSVETSKARSVGPTLRRLWGYFGRYRLALLMVAVGVLASTYMVVLIPDLIGQAVDCYLGPFATGQAAGDLAQELPAEALQLQQEAGPADAFDNCWFTTPDPGAGTSESVAGLGRLVLLIAGLYAGSAILSGLQFYLMSRAGFQVLRDLRADVFEHIHRLTLGYLTRHEAGDIMSRLTNDIDTIQQVIGFGLVSVLQGVLLIIWVVITMVRLSPPYALVSLVTLPLMFLATSWLSTQARRAFRRARQEIGAVNADLQENISAVREVQAFSREGENIEQFRVSNAANRDANIQAQAFSSALAPTLEALSFVTVAVVAVAGGLAILNQGEFLGTTVSVGLIVTFIGYSQQFNRPVQQIATLWTNIQSGIAGTERIFDLLDEVPDLADKPGAETLQGAEGHVILEGVHARYNADEPVLRGIDIEALPGQTIAIVGPTGAGKTTIINLLPRFYDVTEGRVLIDGRDVRDVSRSSLRRLIGMVPQDTFLFSDTVIDNIRYGRPEASDEEVIAAAKLARAHGFIERLEDGYQTFLGERGAGLSQGQRQLLAIARVALTDPRVLILDEATSSVDTRTERQIQEALNQLLANRTSFVIAHRLSTVRNADLVLYLEEGLVVERGTHDELLAARGAYADLYMSQFRRQVEDESTDTGDHVTEPDASLIPGD